MNLPYFRFHPEPLKNGSIVDQNIVCDCCKRPSEYSYVGPFFSEHDVNEICPHCIADGSAAEKFKGEFLSRDDFEGQVGDVINPSIIDELTQRTPGFLAAQQAIWLCLGGLPGAYQGDFNRVNAPFMTDEFWQNVKETTETWNQEEFEALKKGALRGSVSLHVFKDLNSDRRTGYFDYT